MKRLFAISTAALLGLGSALAAPAARPAARAPVRAAFTARQAVVRPTAQVPVAQARLATPVTRRFTVNVGGNVINGLALNVGVAANSLVDFGRTSLGGRLSAEAFGPSGYALGADALVNVPLEAVTLYAGPGLGYSFNSSLGNVFGNVVAGASVPIDASLGFYGEGLYRNYFNGNQNFGARVGLNYSF